MIGPRKPWKWVLILFILVVLEALSSSILLPVLDKRITSVIYFASGLLISFISLIKSKISSGFTSRSIWYYALLVIFCYFLVKWVTVIYPDILVTHPLDFKHADMLPVIKTMNERLLRGDYIFDPIHYIWAGTIPIYLPAMWIPFLPAIYFTFDMRWITIAATLVAIITWLLLGSRRKNIKIEILLLTVPITILMFHYLHRNDIFFPRTQEGLIIGFYLLLAFGLWKRFPVMTGICIALCSMSRYSFIGWLGIFVWYLLENESVKYRIKLVASVGIITIGLLMIGQGYKHLPTYLKLQNIYVEAISDPANDFKYRPLIQNSLGLAKFLPYESLPRMHYLSILLSIIFPFLFYYWGKSKDLIRRNPNLFMICALKFSLVIFYNLLIIPYLYLFLTSTFLSLGVLYAYLDCKPESLVSGS